MFKALKNTLTNVAKTFWVRPLKTLVILYDDLPNYGSCSLKNQLPPQFAALGWQPLGALRKSFGISWWNPKVGIRYIHVCPVLVMIKPPKVDHLCHLKIPVVGRASAISWYCHFVTMTLLRKKRLLKKKRKKASCVGNQWDLWTMELQFMFVIILTVNNYWYWYYH